MTVLEAATCIVREREYQYHGILADMYFMALLSEEREFAEQIWQEAWSNFNGHLVALLISIDFQFATREDAS